MNNIILAGLLALLTTFAAPLAASTRGQHSSVQIYTDSAVLDAGERYAIHLEVAERGFVYVYSLDPRGNVSLLFPTRKEDGQGAVEAGSSFSIEPVLAGQLPGRESLVAVHTKEYRRVKKSRHQFLAPDPDDLEDLHYRLTRRDRELGNYSVWNLSIDGPEILADADPEESRAGIVVNSVHYDYYCSFCDFWHPTCSLDHCWCDYRVIGYYHNHYHYGHCFHWGPRHWWWQPPVVYIYVQGGSPWDYDTRPWRTKAVWRRNRHYSREWRDLQLPSASDYAAQWKGLKRPNIDYRGPDLKSSLRQLKASTPANPKSKRHWSTKEPSRTGSKKSRSGAKVQLGQPQQNKPHIGSAKVPARPQSTPAGPERKPAIQKSQPAPPSASKTRPPAKRKRAVKKDNDGKKKK